MQRTATKNRSMYMYSVKDSVRHLNKHNQLHTQKQNILSQTQAQIVVL